MTFFFHKYRFYILACLLGILLCAEAQANVRLPAILSSNMVLQADREIRLWGWADVGDAIEIRVSWSKRTYTVKPDRQGLWQLEIMTPTYSKKAYSISFTDGTTVQTIDNILVGEVWLCSGQSNMDFPISKGERWRTGILDEDEQMEDADYPEIRFFHVQQQLSADRELNDCVGEWKTVHRSTIGDFSAVAFFYGRMLYKSLGRPIGLIQSTWGGTHAESWTSMAIMQGDPLYSRLLQGQQEQLTRYTSDTTAYPNPNNNNSAGTLWNAMINPLVNFSIAGVIWYQGESNANRASDYCKVFANMVANWRVKWAQGNFPFYFVQIAPHYKQPPELRQAQLEASQIIPNSGMVVISDVGDSTDIHPRNKRVVGERLAQLALAKTYKKHLDYTGPQLKSVDYKEGEAILSFSDRLFTIARVGHENIAGFEVCGPSGEFYTASVEMKRRQIVLSSAQVREVVGVRYAWRNYFRANITGRNGFPLGPFRVGKVVEK